MPYNLKLDQKFGLPDNYKIEYTIPKYSTKGVKYDDGDIFSWYTIGNRNLNNNNFAKAKNRLKNEVYNGVDLALRTYYCGCPYENSTGEVNHKPCGLEHDNRYIKRYEKIEWEHVVPAESYLGSFPEWSDGHPECISSNQKKYKGRKCLEKVSKKGKYMISDMHNLFPVTGHLNALRSNYPVGEIPGEKRMFGLCNIEIEDRKMEPDDDIRGDIARVYKYMHYTYPEYTIEPEYMKILKRWSELDPISSEECERYSIILETQKSINLVLHKYCMINHPNYFNSKMTL